MLCEIIEPQESRFFPSQMEQGIMYLDRYGLIWIRLEMNMWLCFNHPEGVKVQHVESYVDDNGPFRRLPMGTKVILTQQS